MTDRKSAPYHSLSASDAVFIVASHDKLQAWNDANEQALNAGDDRTQRQTLNNIRKLAAAVIASEKSLSSQNFELRRALNLYDKTLNLSDFSEGAVAGAIHAMADKLEPVTANVLTPSSMNLADAQARSQALQNLIPDTPEKALAAAIKLGNRINVAGQAATKMVELVWQQPGIVPAALVQSAQAQISSFRQDLRLSMHAENPSYALGTVLGVTALGAAGLAVNPASKTQSLEKISGMDWGAYQNLVGPGLHLPKSRQPRDFTDLMKVNDSADVPLTISYSPAENHYIVAEVRYLGSQPEKSNMGLSFDVIAGGNRELHGSGWDMVGSTMEKLGQLGVRVREFRAIWMPIAPSNSNHIAYVQATKSGMSPEVAARCTFSGKCMGNYGLTEVGGDPFRKMLKANPEYSVLTPFFTRPNFGGGAKYQNYAEAWVDAMGRSKRELVPRVAPEPQVKPAVDIIGRLSAYLQENFTQEAGAKVMDAVSNTLKVSIKSSDVTR